MRQEGVQNYQRRDSDDLVAVQVKIPRSLKKAFIAAIYPRPMVAVIEQLIGQYVQQGGAFGISYEEDGWLVVKSYPEVPKPGAIGAPEGEAGK